jgi:hypothetical protein
MHHSTCEDQKIGTRSSSKRKVPEIGEEEWPAGVGDNFVDLTLRVVVKQAQGTMMAFKPTEVHGMTWLYGAHNRGLSLAFSSRILDAFQKAQEGIQIESSAGAGDSNLEST